MEIVKQVLGVDVAQKELVVSLGRIFNDLSKEVYAHKVFSNKASGIMALLKWVKKNSLENVDVHFVMEATGVYHEKLAYFLDEKGYSVSIVLPNKISNYMRTLETKTITDKTCSHAITLFGLERQLDTWQRPKAIYKCLLQLTRERDQIVAERSMVKNQLHAEQVEALPNLRSIKRLKQRIKFLNQQEQEIKNDIDVSLEEEKDIQAQIKNITTIPGVGKLTAVIVLAETNGFELIRNKKQLSSYAGFDIKEKQSGTSIKSKPRISKKGNRHLRKAMHLPSLSTVKHDENYKEVYKRIVSKHGIKMKALIAIQRKMLELIYTLYKNKTSYCKEYIETKRGQLMEVAPLTN
ncbi:MAG: IS110 family transposase [Bacteroidetes bacterium]|nr:IS110 family transposase [Bacteroidota bacterium]MBK7108305.1 IS110 family transposase [Bacteroidota bacterium]MBK8681456.1 IS110 family transposase [Bacteroidota bacterium]